MAVRAFKWPHLIHSSYKKGASFILTHHFDVPSTSSFFSYVYISRTKPCFAHKFALVTCILFKDSSSVSSPLQSKASSWVCSQWSQNKVKEKKPPPGVQGDWRISRNVRSSDGQHNWVAWLMFRCSFLDRGNIDLKSRLVTACSNSWNRLAKMFNFPWCCIHCDRSSVPQTSDVMLLLGHRGFTQKHAGC